MPQLSADVAALLALGVADIPGTLLMGVSANRAAPVLLPADLYGTVAQYGAAAAAVAGNLQQVLDAYPAGSVVSLPPGIYDLPAPLFPGDRVLVGAGRVETVLRHAATPVVTGWPRGLVSDAHFVTTLLFGLLPPTVQPRPEA